MKKAIKKKLPHPLVLFIDTNIPAELAERFFPVHKDGKPVSPKLIEGLGENIRKEHGGKDPFNAIVFTNHPHHYSEDDQIDPRGRLLFVMSSVPMIPLSNPAALWSLMRAAELYGNIPSRFPEMQQPIVID